MGSAFPPLTYVTATDEAVVGGLLVSVASFLHQHREADSLRVCVIDGGLEAATWLRFEKEITAWAATHGVVFSLEKWDGELERWQHLPPHWGSWAVYSSLDIFLKDLTGWVIFGDVDFLHGRAIWEELHSVADHPQAVGAVVDPFKVTSEADKYVHLVRPEIKAWVDYFNTGFLVVDRDRFDAVDFANFLDAMELGILDREKGKRSLFDQSLLNGYFAGEVALLPICYNRVVRDGRDFRFGNEASNLHFVGQPKPWGDLDHQESERFVAWVAAAAALDLGDADLEPSLLPSRKQPRLFWKKWQYRLLGKKEKLAQLDSRFSESELSDLFDTVKSWFSVEKNL